MMNQLNYLSTREVKQGLLLLADQKAEIRLMIVGFRETDSSFIRKLNLRKEPSLKLGFLAFRFITIQQINL
jgi:hypothetical protein